MTWRLTVQFDSELNEETLAYVLEGVLMDTFGEVDYSLQLI